MNSKMTICIVTTTYYNLSNEAEKTRFILSKETIKKAISSGYEFIIIDGGSPLEVVNEFISLKAKVISQSKKGLGEARRQAFIEGYNSGKEIIIWTEPEKHDLIRHIPMIVKPLIENKADIVLPSRNSIDSYPLAQQYIEPFCNLFWKELTKTDFDMWFGPRVMLRDIASFFINYKSNYGDKWDNLHLPVIDILKSGKRVVNVKIDYIHDKRQTQDEEHSISFFMKRVEQLNNLLPVFEEYWNKKS